MATNSSTHTNSYRPPVSTPNNSSAPAPSAPAPAPAPSAPTQSAPSSAGSPSYTPTYTPTAPVVITYSVTKTNYFNNVNIDEIYTVCIDILQKLRNYGLIYNLAGLWDSATAVKLQKELNKMHIYLEILCATLQGYVDMLNQAKNIKSLQSQVDSYCTDLTSYDNYVAANNLITQINSLMGNINPSLSAMQTQAVLPASVNETFSSPVASNYRFCYNAVLGVANQANSDRMAIVGYYQSFCNLEASVRGDSYTNSGWNIVVQVFDKFIKKADLIANWWINYFANVRTIEQKLPDGEFNVSETPVDSYGRSHDIFAIPSFDAYRTANQGESLNFNIPGRSGSGASGTNRISSSNGAFAYSSGTYTQSRIVSGNRSSISNQSTASYINQTGNSIGSGTILRTNVSTPNQSTASYINQTGNSIGSGTILRTNASTPNQSTPYYVNQTGNSIGPGAVLRTNVSTPNQSTPYYVNQENNNLESITNLTNGASMPNTAMYRERNSANKTYEQSAVQPVQRDYNYNSISYVLHDQNSTELSRAQFDQYGIEYNNFMRALDSNYPNIHDLVENGTLSGQQLSNWASDEITNLNTLLEEQRNIVETETAAAESANTWRLTNWQQDVNDHTAAANQAQRTAQHYESLINTFSNITDHGNVIMNTHGPGSERNYTVVDNTNNN